jgi:hypothetical protein
MVSGSGTGKEWRLIRKADAPEDLSPHTVAAAVNGFSFQRRKGGRGWKVYSLF